MSKVFVWIDASEVNFQITFSTKVDLILNIATCPPKLHYWDFVLVYALLVPKLILYLHCYMSPKVTLLGLSFGICTKCSTDLIVIKIKSKFYNLLEAWNLNRGFSSVSTSPVSQLRGTSSTPLKDIWKMLELLAYWTLQ